MQLFDIDEHQSFDELSIVIKYDGPSFKGVMNIVDLGNELIGIEYCLKTILKKLAKENKKNIKDKEIINLINQLNIDDFELITEGFVNNCFLKKIKFNKEKIKGFLDEIEKRPELNKYILGFLGGGFAIYGTIYVAQMNIDKDLLLKAIEKGNVSTEVIQYVTNSNLSNDSKRIALQLIRDPKYREESSKTIVPISAEKDSLTLSSKTFAPIGQDSIKIEKKDTAVFLANSYTSDDEEEDKVEYDTVIGRINYIDLDARMNQVGFKVLNEGSEISCHLIDSLNIHDYKDYLGDWVEIEGNITYSYDKTKYIEIHKIKRTSAPLSEATQTIIANF